MASRIAGITIEIGGDTTKLQNALKKTNSNLKTTQNELKDVNKLLKLDPKSTELLQQKQKLLSSATKEVSDKLKVEKEALAQLKAGPQTEETIRQQEALTREIIATSQELDSLQKEYKDFGSVAKQQAQAAAKEIEALGGKISSVGDNISAVGNTMTKGLTVPTVAAAGASVAAWTEVDEAMDTIIVKTGATGDALEDMQGIAKNISKTIPVSFQKSADAVGEVNTRFEVTGDELEDLSKQFVEFAELNETDVSTSVDTVQSALAAFNLGAEDAGNMLDILNKAGQDTGTSVDTLAATLTTNAATLQEMGYNAADSAMLIANLSKNGIDATAAMTGLKKAYAESVETGIPMNDMLSDLAERLQNSETNADATAEAMELFGTKAGPQLVAALESGRLSFDQLGLAMDTYSGNVASTYENTLDPLDQMTTTMNTLKETGSELVEAAGPLLIDIMQQLASGAQTLLEWWNSLDQSQQEMVLKCAAVAAAAGPVISVGGSIVSGIGSLVSAGSGLITTIGGIAGKFTGMATSAGQAVESVASVGTAATSAAAPMSSAGSAMGTLSQNALGLVAAGAGIALVSAGMYILAQAAIQIAQAGPGAAVAMVGLVAAVAAMAVGAAALAPALTAGAVGLVAFGAGVTLVGVGILAATAGMALLATQLPTIATYGGSAALAIGQIALSMTAMGASAVVAGAGLTTMLVPMAGAALTIGAVDLALIGFTASVGLASVSVAALGVAMLAVSEPVESIKENAEAAGTALEDMVASVDIIGAALDGLQSLISDAGAWLSGLFEKETPKASASATKLGQTVTTSMNTSVNTGLTKVNATWMSNLDRTNTIARMQMMTVERTILASINRIKTLFANTEFAFNQNIKLPHFSMVGSFDPESGSTPSVSVSWYRKAYDEAYVLNGATIFGAMGGRLLGGGEGSGSEMVIGTNKLIEIIQEATAGSGGFVQNLTINSPKQLNPSETARLNRNELRKSVLKLKGRR